jgi:aromatic-L-amino-acid/L-tryptophan decarboxylase
MALSLVPADEAVLRAGLAEILQEERDDAGTRPFFPQTALPKGEKELDAALGLAHAPAAPSAADRVLPLVRNLVRFSSNIGRPHQFGYVIGSSPPVGGDFEALMAQLRLVPWPSGVAAERLELGVARWLGELIGFARPGDTDGAAGTWATGGSMANLLALATARTARAGFDVRQEGLQGGDHPALVFYTSVERHSCIDKAIELLGVGMRFLRLVPAKKGTFQIDIEALVETIEQDVRNGHRPCCVIGTIGTVNCGSVDPIDELADVCERFGCWLHLDGAYGGLAALVPELRKSAFKGLERADSVALDPPKWLNTCFGGAVALFHDYRQLQATFMLIPPYLIQSANMEHVNTIQLGFELSRNCRALAVWSSLHLYGSDKFVELIRTHCRLARELAEWVESEPEFEVVALGDLSTVNFRYQPWGETADLQRVNELNTDIERRVQADERVGISSTIIGGIFALRVTLVNWRVTAESVELLKVVLREVCPAAAVAMKGE